MSRYRSTNPLDDAPLTDGDGEFRGFRSRVQPAALPQGVASYLGNMRCERGAARVREGIEAVGTDLDIAGAPVVLDFTLPTGKAVTSITRSSSTATVTTTAAHGWSTGAIVCIEGATQTEYNGDFTITVTGATTFTYTVSGTPATPATGTIKAYKGAVIYDTYGNGVLAAGVYADSTNTEGIVLATANSAYVYRAGSSITTIAYPAGETLAATDVCALEQFLDKVYLFRGYKTAATAAVTSITRSGATATVTTTAAHSQSTGAWVTIAGAAQAEYNGVFQITVTGASTFTYAVSGTPASPATGTITARFCKIPLVWSTSLAAAFTTVTAGYHATGGTIIRMPAVDWGIQFTRRLVLPYARTELILSDFGDAESYDTQYAQLRILPGGSDWLVGVIPYQNLGLIVLYRKSVHKVTLQTTTATPASVQEVTRDFGCAARRTAANCGNLLLWLSDQGVTGLQIDDSLNTVPLSLPLSDQIQDLIDRINWTYAANATARFWNNRYYLAVPLDSDGTNTTLLVFNFLNRSADSPLGEWESVDTFTGDFAVREFAVLDFEGRKRLHAVTTAGWIFVLEEGEVDQWGSPGTPVTSHAITGSLISRDYRMGTLDRKRYRRVQIETNLSDEDALSVDFVTRNTDSRATLGTYTATSDTDVSLRLRTARQRGTSGVVEITTTAGRPEIRTLSVEATAGDALTTIRP